MEDAEELSHFFCRQINVAIGKQRHLRLYLQTNNVVLRTKRTRLLPNSEKSMTIEPNSFVHLQQITVTISLVPRRSPPAHLTRLGAKCRDVTE